jgi:hypothetical protein
VPHHRPEHQVRHIESIADRRHGPDPRLGVGLKGAEHRIVRAILFAKCLQQSERIVDGCLCRRHQLPSEKRFVGDSKNASTAASHGLHFGAAAVLESHVENCSGWSTAFRDAFEVDPPPFLC